MFYFVSFCLFSYFIQFVVVTFERSPGVIYLAILEVEPGGSMVDTIILVSNLVISSKS